MDDLQVIKRASDVTEVVQIMLMLLNNALSIKSYHTEFYTGNLQVSTNL
jgi:hypothetical protein